MGKSQQKRRSGTASTPSHQTVKSATKKRRKIDWTRWALIVIGIMIVISMILSLIR